MKRALLLLLVATPAAAQPNGGQVTDVEVPSIVIETPGENQSQANDEALDLANIVQSAAKGVTSAR